MQGFYKNKDNFFCNSQFSWWIFLPYTYVIEFSTGYVSAENQGPYYALVVISLFEE